MLMKLGLIKIFVKQNLMGKKGEKNKKIKKTFMTNMSLILAISQF